MNDRYDSAVPPNPLLLNLESPAKAALVWRHPQGAEAIASAVVGGGRSQPKWVVNIGVPGRYNRTDLGRHAHEVADTLDLEGPGVALFTSAKLDFWRRSEVDGVVADCTAGIGKPTFAASADDGWSEWSPGTINIVATLPYPLTEAAAVNAVMTLTEAKCQALSDLGVPGTGTATDAAVVLWPTSGEAEAFCGPRSFLGSRLANATYEAVKASSVATYPTLQ